MALEFQIPPDLQTDVQIRRVTPADVPMLAEWTRAHGHGERLPVVALPPLGVIVEDAHGPAAALWCYETFGIGLATLRFPVTRPGLAMDHARRVVAAAIKACVDLAGQSCVPVGEFGHFEVAASPAMVRFLERLGFRAYGPPKQMMLLEL